MSQSTQLLEKLHTLKNSYAAAVARDLPYDTAVVYRWRIHTSDQHSHIEHITPSGRIRLTHRIYCVRRDIKHPPMPTADDVLTEIEATKRQLRITMPVDFPVDSIIRTVWGTQVKVEHHYWSTKMRVQSIIHGFRHTLNPRNILP